MRRGLLSVLALTLALIGGMGTAKGQTAADLGEGLRVSVGALPGDFTLAWWGRPGRTYFIQQSFDLQSWAYVPAIESGADDICGMNFNCSDPRQFWRLVHTDAPTGGNALAADFDGDGIANADEVSVAYGTDPFLRDSDWDGFPDLTEVTAGTSPHAGDSRPAAAPPGSGALNPDSSYRNGLRLAYSQKIMEAETQSSSTSLSSSGYGYHSAAAGSVYFYPPASSTTADLVPGVRGAYQATPFLEPDRYLFQTATLHALQSWEQKAVSTPSDWLRYLSRNRYEVQAQASPAAPPDAQRTLVGLLYKHDLGQPASRLMETGTITLTQHNVECSATMQRHCQISGSKVIIEPTPEKELADPAPPAAPGWADADQIYFLRLMDVDIGPDTGMAGVVGDVIKSAKPGSRVRHFVTPKKSDELPQEHVEFKVVGADTTQFTDLFEWEGGEEGSAPDKRKVKRDTTGMTSVKIKTKKDHVVVDEMQVWVVWCDAQKAGDWPIESATGNVTTGDGTTGPGVGIYGGYEFKFLIAPSKLITGTERPDFSGMNQYQGATVDPPGAGTLHFVTNKDLKGGAISKWDVSRYVRCKILNPQSFNKNQLVIVNGMVWAAQPVATDLPAAFPNDSVTGNDDAGVGDEDNDPYVESDYDHLSHDIGEVSSADNPGISMRNSIGADGDTFEMRSHFGEFARLLIGEKWFRVSSPLAWRAHIKLKRQNGAWTDDSSETALDNDNF